MELTFNVLNSICRVGKQLKNSKLSARAMRHVEKDVKNIAGYLGTSETQAAIFSLIYQHNYNNCESATVPDIAQYLSLDTIEMLKYNKDFLQLEQKNICVTDKSRRRNNAPEFMDIHYTVSAELSEAIFDNKKIVLEKNPVAKKDLMSWLRFVGDAFAEADRDASPRIISRKLTQEEKKYETCADVQKFKQLLPETNSRMLFYDFAYDKIFKSGESSLKETLQDLYGYDNDSIINIGKLFMDKKHELQKMDLVELESTESFDDATIELTEKGLELVVGENIDLYRKTVSDKEMIVPEKIVEKKLFYGKDTQEQIQLVRSSLDGKKFVELKKRLTEKNLPEGICVLLYGAPGTGKTESVRQIAKATGRKIYHVDISETKSCWFGESEKRIKEIFKKYRSFCECTEKLGEPVPFLLFNEADAVFAKRKDSSSSNVAQTENAIQNIILEEMETLPGILIATTNLADNLDAAFERRFLFKIKFDKPTNEARMNIWKDKLDMLSQDEAMMLAERYNFSGGEIDNIVRKLTMRQVIDGSNICIDEIEKLCSHEKLHDEDRRIGFRNF